MQDYLIILQYHVQLHDHVQIMAVIFHYCCHKLRKQSRAWREARVPRLRNAQQTFCQTYLRENNK